MDFGLYARYRPSYPASVLNMLRESGILDGSRTVADIGSGIGLFTDLLLRAGHEVFGVEPDDDARAIAERRLARHSAFTSVDGSAERTNLPAGAADLVTAASSLHWFRQDSAVAEMRRILRGARWCVALWNFWEPAGSAFGEAFDRRWRDLLGPPPAGAVTVGGRGSCGDIRPSRVRQLCDHYTQTEAIVNGCPRRSDHLGFAAIQESSIELSASSARCHPAAIPAVTWSLNVCRWVDMARGSPSEPV